MTAPKTIHEMKKAKLARALRRCEGNRTEAAKMLGISIRTVRNWIDQFDLREEFPVPSVDGPTAVDEYLNGKRGAIDFDE